ncbi:unnamed protein product [Arctia plantaginis]|uniref:Uncharacterized protein n=1 Tax=Arctia plantaginis TaxID=874455 RepID=A0A8S1ARP3_ARCPL|nr:unnamed protein product [Arctia plantaginis]
MLEEYWSSYAKHYDVIIQASPKVLAKFDALQEYEITENPNLDCRTLLMEALYSLRAEKENRECTKVVTMESTSTSRVKLPPINIPRFAGNYEDLIRFRNLFTALVNNDERLSNMEKCHYLRSSVCGNAEIAIKNLAVSGSNFERAWSILENRYDNKRIIENNVLNIFFNQKTLTTECARGLKELLDTTTVTLDDLQSLSIDIRVGMLLSFT